MERSHVDKRGFDDNSKGDEKINVQQNLKVLIHTLRSSSAATNEDSSDKSSDNLVLIVSNNNCTSSTAAKETTQNEFLDDVLKQEKNSSRLALQHGEMNINPPSSSPQRRQYSEVDEQVQEMILLSLALALWLYSFYRLYLVWQNTLNFSTTLYIPSSSSYTSSSNSQNHRFRRKSKIVSTNWDIVLTWVQTILVNARRRKSSTISGASRKKISGLTVVSDPVINNISKNEQQHAKTTYTISCGPVCAKAFTSSLNEGKVNQMGHDSTKQLNTLV